MRSFVLLAFAVSALAVACSEPHDATFSYESYPVPVTTTTPMMLGDEEDVIVGGSIPQTVSVESTVPSIVLVSATSRFCRKNDNVDAGAGISRMIAMNDACTQDETATLHVTVRAMAEGSSDLLIKKSDDSVWGSVTLSVEKATSLALGCGMTMGSVTLALGDYCSVTWKATDATGRELMSTSGLFLTSSDAAVVKFSKGNTISGDTTTSHGFLGGASIIGVGSGDATVTATGGGATETLAVHVN